MKKVLAIVLAMMLVLSASAAFAAEYEIVSKGFQHQYWQAVLKGAEKKAEELGVEINPQEAGTSVKELIAYVDSKQG